MGTSNPSCLDNLRSCPSRAKTRALYRLTLGPRYISSWAWVRFTLLMCVWRPLICFTASLLTNLLPCMSSFHLWALSDGPKEPLYKAYKSKGANNRSNLYLYCEHIEVMKKHDIPPKVQPYRSDHAVLWPDLYIEPSRYTHTAKKTTEIGSLADQVQYPLYGPLYSCKEVVSTRETSLTKPFRTITREQIPQYFLGRTHHRFCTTSVLNHEKRSGKICYPQVN